MIRGIAAGLLERSFETQDPVPSDHMRVTNRADQSSADRRERVGPNVSDGRLGGLQRIEGAALRAVDVAHVQHLGCIGKTDDRAALNAQEDGIRRGRINRQSVEDFPAQACQVVACGDRNPLCVHSAPFR